MCLAIPGRIVEITEDAEPSLRRGKVDFAGVRKEVSLAFTPEAKTGDYVLVHVGFALNVVDEDEAQKIFEQLDQMAAIDELQGESGS
jgi:hydrogenase expression/formation protein HypC